MSQSRSTQQQPTIATQQGQSSAQTTQAVQSGGRGNGFQQAQNQSTGQSQLDPKAEAARKKITDFCAQTYSRKDWVTANGYGAFDLVYEPTTSIAFVTVNIEFDFENAPPSVLMKYVAGLDFGNMVECIWTDDKKKTFQDDMIAQVDRVWSNKVPVRCTHTDPDLTDGKKPTWQDLHADMQFVVKPVTSGGHFKVRALALPAADSLRSHVDSDDHDATAGVAPDRSGMRMTTAGSVARKDFVTTGAQLNSHDNDKKDIPSSFDGMSYTVVKGDSLWSIAAKLLGDGKRWKEIYDNNKGVVGADPNLILPGQGLVLKVPPTKQVTTAHEFGHMLGLDDQYVGAGGGTGVGGDLTDDGVNRTSKVPAEEHQIMDGGEVVEPGHYATVVEALNDATKPIVFAA